MVIGNGFFSENRQMALVEMTERSKCEVRHLPFPTVGNITYYISYVGDLYGQQMIQGRPHLQGAIPEQKIKLLKGIMERDKIEKKCIFTKDSYTDEDRKVLCEDCEEECKYAQKSEGLDEAAFDYAESCKYEGGEKLLCIEHFKAGANWQKDQFEKNRLAHCDAQTEEEAEIEQSFVMGIIEKEHRQPTFDDAIKYGMRLQRENMMEDAIDVEVKMDAGGYPYIDKTIELYDYDKDIPLAKMGDKYKVVLIKED